MKKLLLIPIIIGGLLAATITAGVVMTVVSAANNKDVTNEYALSDQVITNFDFDLDTSDVIFVPSELSEQKVVCKETTKTLHEVKVEEGTLKITQHDTRRFFEMMSWGKKYSVTVYLPKGVYNTFKVESHTGDISISSDYSFVDFNVRLSTGDVSLKANVANEVKVITSTGNVKCDEITTKSVDITTSTGNVTLNKVTVLDGIDIGVSTGHIILNETTASTLDATSSTGNMKLANSVMSGDIHLKASTGDIKFEDSDGANIHVETSTGDVKGTLLTAKVFDVKTTSGKINVPPSGVGGLCYVRTSTGDVFLSIK